MAEEPKVLEEALKDALKAKDEEQNVEDNADSNINDSTQEEQIKKGSVGNNIPSIESLPSPEPKIDENGRSYATGKRKDAMARVWIKPGSGRIQVNGRALEIYFARPVLRMIISQPFEAVERKDQYDVYCTVRGGGLSGQAGALRHGISKALTLYEPGLRPLLKKGGFLTRDSRVVERKKYGRRKARRSFQFSKR